MSLSINSGGSPPSPLLDEPTQNIALQLKRLFALSNPVAVFAVLGRRCLRGFLGLILLGRSVFNYVDIVFSLGPDNCCVLQSSDLISMECYQAAEREMLKKE